MSAERLEFDPSTVGELATLLCLSPMEAGLLAADHPFRQFGEWRGFATLTGAAMSGRLVASVDSRQQHAGGVVGCIGFVRSRGVPPGSLDSTGATSPLLDAALGWLAQRGVSVVRGPIDFSTWYGHRAIVGGDADADEAPRFPLEPANGPAVADAFAAAGFQPAHHAISYAVSSGSVITSSALAVARFAKAEGRDRPLDLDDLEAELRLLHDLSSRVFRTSWGFSELSFEEFATLYRPLVPLVDAELVRVLELNGHAVGFAFALPHASMTDGSPTAVVKTLGVLPEVTRRHPGSGAALTALIHRSMQERGVTTAVHALMAQGSAAHRLSARWGRPIRTYATFERSLT